MASFRLKGQRVNDSSLVARGHRRRLGNADGRSSARINKMNKRPKWLNAAHLRPRPGSPLMPFLKFRLENVFLSACSLLKNKLDWGGYVKYWISINLLLGSRVTHHLQGLLRHSVPALWFLREQRFLIVGCWTEILFLIFFFRGRELPKTDGKRTIIFTASAFACSLSSGFAFLDLQIRCKVKRGGSFPDVNSVLRD